MNLNNCRRLARLSLELWRVTAPFTSPHRSHSTARFHNQFAELVSAGVCFTSIGRIGGQLVIDQWDIWGERANKHRLFDCPVLACRQPYLSGSCQKIRYERLLKLIIEFLTGHILMGRMGSLQGWCICDYDFIFKRRRPRCKETACKVSVHQVIVASIILVICFGSGVI
jgi:hypothetical protein